jgi:hypothetical protein
MDIFKKVPPYQLFEAQQLLLDSIGPREIDAKSKDWQRTFWSRDISEPIKKFLETDEFEEDTPLETKLKRVVAFLKNESEAGNLDYCLKHTQEDNLERQIKTKLSFVAPIWESQPGFTKKKAFAAIKALVSLEIFYYFTTTLNETPDFPLKQRYQEQLTSLIQGKLATFEKEATKSAFMDRFLKHKSLNEIGKELKNIYKKSTFKKDLHLIQQCANLWRQPIPKITFFKNLSWVCARLFRLCATALPMLWFHLSISVFPLLAVTVFVWLGLPLLRLTHFLGQRFFSTKLQQIRNTIAKTLSVVIGIFILSAFTLGWLWFALSLMQGISLILGTGASLSTPATGLTAMLIGATKLFGPLIWMGIPLGMGCSVLTFAGISLYTQILLPIKRAFTHEAVPSLDNLKQEVLSANKNYHQEITHTHYNNPVCLFHPFYVDDMYQVCFSPQEITDIKQQAVLSRFNDLGQNMKNYITSVFQKLQQMAKEDPKFASEPIVIDLPHSRLPLLFKYQRNQNFEEFKTEVAHGISDNVNVEECPVPRL